MIEYLVFWIGDGGDRESNSVYYSKLIKGDNETDVIKKYISYSDNIDIEKIYFDDYNKEYYGTIKVDDLKLK